MDFQSRIKGCYWGLCLGDALGMPIEFKNIKVIREVYGHTGILTPPKDAIFTDDTEMTIAVTKALLSMGKAEEIAKLDDNSIGEAFANEYIEWLKNPGFAPGGTCMGSIQYLKKHGATSWKDSAIDSKGCGTVMRSAPLGLWFAEKIGEELKTGDRTYHNELKRVSIIQSEITHSHKAATAAAIAGAYSVALACNDVQPTDMVAYIKDLCNGLHQDFDLIIEKLERILFNKSQEKIVNDYEVIKTLGQGWIGEEAFAIAMYSVIQYPNDFVKCLQTSVNHDGDSDSTGCIAGSIIGALHGYDQIPPNWIELLLDKDRYSSFTTEVLEYFEE